MPTNSLFIASSCCEHKKNTMLEEQLKASIILHDAICNLFEQSGKSRRENSIDRPFTFDSLTDADILRTLETLRPHNNTNGESTNEIERPYNWVNPTLQLDSIQRILKYYGQQSKDGDPTENTILFVDASTFQVIRCEDPPFWKLEPRLIVVTFHALFIMEPIEEFDMTNAGKNLNTSRPSPGTLRLRRIVPFSPTTSDYSSVSDQSNEVDKKLKQLSVSNDDSVMRLSKDEVEDVAANPTTNPTSNTGTLNSASTTTPFSYAEIAKQCYGHMERVHLSRQADNCLVVMVKVTVPSQQQQGELQKMVS